MFSDPSATSQAVLGTAHMRWAPVVLTVLLVTLFCGGELFAQAPAQSAQPSSIAPLKLEFSQHFDPWDPRGRTAVDSFKLGTTVRTAAIQYSSQAPAFLGGKQFPAIPGGYSILELLLKTKWGALQAFRSTGYSTRLLSRGSARNLTGTVVDVPKAVFSSNLSGYFVRASPSDPAVPGAPPTTSQAGIVLARDLGKRLSLAAEWTRSWQEGKAGALGRPGGGLFLRARGNLAHTEATVTYRVQGQGFTNPAMPVAGPRRMLQALDLSRTYKKHQIQYGRQLDALGATHFLSVPFSENRQDGIRWIYSPKVWPQLSASRMWSVQRSRGVWQEQNDTRLAVSKALKKITLALAHLRSGRSDALALRPVWGRVALVGDAGIEIQKNSRLNLHYESNAFTVLHPSQAFVHTDVLQSSTRLAFLGGKLALMPAVDVCRQRDRRGTTQSSSQRMLLSALVKIPARMMGTGSDLLISFRSQHAKALGRPGQDSIGLVVQWSVKRL